MDQSFINGIKFKRGDGESPEVFTAMKKVISFSGLGVTNPLVEDTTFDSIDGREYIAGLADGTEVTMEQSYLPGNEQQKALMLDVDQRRNRNFEIVVDDKINDITTFKVTFTCLNWTLNPSPDDKNTISFNLKISGGIGRTTEAQPE